MADLASTRAYARDALTDSVEAVVSGCVESLRTFGFWYASHPTTPPDHPQMAANTPPD